MDQESTVQDLLLHSYEQKPVEFQQTFNDLVVQRIASAVSDKKMELAHSLFNEPSDETEPEEPEQAEVQEPETVTQEDGQNGKVA
jgi:hypothetical protein